MLIPVISTINLWSFYATGITTERLTILTGKINLLITVISTINLWPCYATGITADYINWKHQHIDTRYFYHKSVVMLCHWYNH